MLTRTSFKVQKSHDILIYMKWNITQTRNTQKENSRKKLSQQSRQYSINIHTVTWNKQLDQCDLSVQSFLASVSIKFSLCIFQFHFSWTCVTLNMNYVYCTTAYTKALQVSKSYSSVCLTYEANSWKLVRWTQLQSV